MVKNLPAMQETQVRSLGREDPLEEEMATHSSILAWRIPWTEEPSPWGHTESDTTERRRSHDKHVISQNTVSFSFTSQAVQDDLPIFTLPLPPNNSFFVTLM